MTVHKNMILFTYVVLKKTKLHYDGLLAASTVQLTWKVYRLEGGVDEDNDNVRLPTARFILFLSQMSEDNAKERLSLITQQSDKQNS